jgi:hypothetical protein
MHRYLANFPEELVVDPATPPDGILVRDLAVNFNPKLGKSQGFMGLLFYTKISHMSESIYFGFKFIKSGKELILF